MASLEQKETELLKHLECTGEMLRSNKALLRRMCNENEAVKGSAVLELYDKIEEQQSEFYRLNDELTELENA